jgi:hypothetical protein
VQEVDFGVKGLALSVYFKNSDVHPLQKTADQEKFEVIVWVPVEIANRNVYSL